MVLSFEKYQAAGNDFVVLDNREGNYSSIPSDQLRFLCDRHKGVGADGVIFINAHPTADFEMIYFNSDGNKSTLCGNGGRCAVAFAFQKNIISTVTTFMASDGIHHAEWLGEGQVRLQMQNVKEIQHKEKAIITNTGSPHYITLAADLATLDVKNEGAAIRYSPPFKKEGINVNFLEHIKDSHFRIRTYERGVEDETLACGTGAVASALAIDQWGNYPKSEQIHLEARGGNLLVDFKKDNTGYHSIFLQGPATFVFSGTLTL